MSHLFQFPRRFIACIGQPIVIQVINQELDGQGVWHVWDTGEVPTGF